MRKIITTILKGGYRALGYYPTTIDGMKFNCDPYHIGIWRGISKGCWEPYTFRILSRFLSRDSIYCDIGAWIGPTVIYAARKCKRVICFEPDFFAYQYLLQNIHLNSLYNVMPFNLALGDNDGINKMATFWGDLGNSMTSLLGAEQKEDTINVLCMKWETWATITKPETIDFLKIDIEGAEFSLLPTIKDWLARYKPIVYLSTHAPHLDESRRNEEMQNIIKVMGIYKYCFNEKLEALNIRMLETDTAKNSFGSYLFMD
jgi:FkbM family methyltransferase